MGKNMHLFMLAKGVVVHKIKSLMPFETVS